MISWDMEVEEIESVLEKIWDLHDKLSDAIHAISRSHFLNSVKSIKKSDRSPAGFVYAKDFRAADDEAAIAEARSLNDIRTALENLEDQLEFFHTVHLQQRAERDAAIARLEQSRIVLAMRLADHHGKKYKVIEETLAFVGDVKDASRFVAPETLFQMPRSQSIENLEDNERKGSNVLTQLFISSFTFVKKSLKLDHMGGVLGHAALIAVSMLALLQLHQVAFKSDFVLETQAQDDSCYGKRNEKHVCQLGSSSSSGRVKHLDVFSARG